MAPRPRPRERPLSPGHAKQLRQTFADIGVVPVCVATGYHAQTLARAGSELPLGEATCISIERYLDTLPQAESAAE